MIEEQIEKQEDAALLRIASDINQAHDEVSQHRAIERYLRLSLAIAVRNGTFDNHSLASLSEPLLNQQAQRK